MNGYESWLQEGPLLFNPFVFDNRYPFCDFNGDGKNDGFVYNMEPSNNRWVTFFHKNEQRLFMNKITNGLGRKVEISYEPLTNENVYSKDIVIEEKIKNIQPSLYVVSTIAKDDGMNAYFTKKFKYEGAKFHIEGKGFLGYKKAYVEYLSSGIKNISEYSINSTFFFSFITKQQSYIGDDLISESFFENEVIDYGNKRIFSFNDIELQKIYSTGDLGSSYVKTIRVEKSISEVDEDYGNISKYSIFSDEQEFELNEPSSSYDFYTLTNFSYNYAEIDNWLVSRISNKTLIKKKPEDDYEYHEIYNYFYYPESDPLQQFPLLQTETYIPNSANEYQVNTTYQYDIYGNIISKTIEVPNYSIKPVETRSIEFEYSADYNHRFLTKTIMEINDIITFEETMTYYPKTGLLNNHVDINGLTTHCNYDSFGRMNEIISPNGNKTVKVLRWSQDHVDNPINGLYFLWSQTSGLKEVLTFFDNNGRTLRNIGFGLDENSKIFSDFEYFNSSNSAHGRLKTQSDPYFSGESALNTLYTYLPYGQIKTIDSPTTDISYSYNGLNFITNNLSTGQAHTKVLNAIAQLESASDAGGNISYSYNSAGNPIQITNGEGSGQSVISITYNNAGFPTGLQDPDAGNYTYVYNPLGELISSTDENGNIYEMNYDVMGRIIEKKLLSPLQVTTYTYDSENALGLLSSVTGWDGTSTQIMYDQYSMISQKTEIIQGVSYDFNYDYDIWGNLKKETWPTGYEVNYKYKNGFLSKVIESSSSKTLWQVNNINARGQIREYLLGNGLTTVKNFDIYGFPTSIVTSNNIQNLEYNFNTSTGNLTWRKDLHDPANSGDDLIENFGYDQDQLNNRLTSLSVLGGQSFTINYSNNGNINEKSDVGNSYAYNVVGSSGGPHAVSSIVQPTEDYLNMATPQEIEYTAFDKVSQILHPEDFLKLKLWYGPDNQRKISSLFNTNEGKNDILIKKKFFVNNDYEIEVNGQGGERKLHYLYGGDGLFAIYVMENNAANIYYVHKDYQGSYQTITDGNGVKLEELSFDPWGRRRNPVDWSFNNVPDEFLFDRGYTGHEHLDEFNLINMNGRVYDPIVARFLSPDPFVQSPDYTQSYNRYSYGLNNPLKYTDPSGYNYHPDDWTGGGGGGLLSFTPYFGPGYQGGITVLSGNHWSNNYIGEANNFVYTSESTFNGLYGDGASEIGNLIFDTPDTRKLWFSGNLSIDDVRRNEGVYAGPTSDLVGHPGKSFLRNQYGTWIYNEQSKWILIEGSGYYFQYKPQGGGGSNPFTLLDAAGGLLALEDVYNNFFHNHTTYTTTGGVTKNIYKANGAVRSARAAKFATASKFIKGAGFAGTGFMTGVAFINIVDDISKGNALNGKDLLDFSVGAGGLLSLALVANPVSLSVIGSVVAVYSLGSFAYDLYTTDW